LPWPARFSFLSRAPRRAGPPKGKTMPPEQTKALKNFLVAVEEFLAEQQSRTMRTLDEAEQEYADWIDLCGCVQRNVKETSEDLLASGYPVPDSWLLMPIAGNSSVLCRRRDAAGRVTNFRPDGHPATLLNRWRKGRRFPKDLIFMRHVWARGEEIVKVHTEAYVALQRLKHAPAPEGPAAPPSAPAEADARAANKDGPAAPAPPPPDRCSLMTKTEIAARILNRRTTKDVRPRKIAQKLAKCGLKDEGNGNWSIRLDVPDTLSADELERLRMPEWPPSPKVK